MATIVYLDVEDEITTAATRIRNANAPRVGMVIPFGSRVATSRINFRLLAREAQAANRRLDVVAPDASARALAASAGLPVFASVAEYEAALESGEAAAIDEAAATAAVPPWRSSSGGAAGPRGGAAAGVPGSAGVAPSAPASAGMAPEASPQGRRSHARPATEAEVASLAAGGRSAAPANPAAREVPVAPSARHRGRRTGIFILVLALVVVLGLGGAAAAVALPSAAITVTPVLEAVPPVSVTVRADTAATAPDPTGLVIPALTVDVPVTSQGDFAVTGVSVQQTAATGTITFDSINTVNAMPISRGTRVATSDGVTFATTDSVTVPRATVPGGGSTIQHGTATVGVAAVSPGPKGNVPAGAIDQVPSSLAALQISVSNGSATTGGTRTELPKIAPDDVAAAKDKLTTDLGAALTTALADPTLAPQGTTLFPDTARLGAATFTPDAAGLAGKVLKAGQTTFSLKADATATAIAIDETPLKAIGDAAVRAAVKPGYQIVESSIQVTVGDGTVGEDGMVSYPVSASALEHRPLDAAALKSAVLGMTEADATAALAPFGKVAITLWPFWVTGVPTSADRVTLSIETPVAPAATPTPPPTPTPTPRLTKAPASAKPSPSGSAEPAPSGSPVPSG